MDDILEQLQNSIINGNTQAATAHVNTALEKGYSTEKIISEGLFPPMKHLGELLEKGDIYIPEVLLSSRAIHATLHTLRPFISRYDSHKKGTVVIGTVAGDLHDIGKNLIAMILSGSGFEVIDLGVDVTAEEFADAVKSYHPDILALSALLTTTLPEIQTVIDKITDEGLRPQVAIMIGGLPVTLEYAREVKADGYAKSVFEAVAAAEGILEGKTGETLLY